MSSRMWREMPLPHNFALERALAFYVHNRCVGLNTNVATFRFWCASPWRSTENCFRPLLFADIPLESTRPP